MAVVKLTAENFEKEVLQSENRYWSTLCRLVRTMSDDGTGSGRDFK